MNRPTIFEPNLKWANPLTPLNLSKVDTIVLHHIAHPTWDIYDCHKYHKSLGWSGVGYNYFVDNKGLIWKGRDLNISAAVLGHNEHTINVAFQGDFDTLEQMPSPQKESGQKLIDYLFETIKTISFLKGHGELGTTSCPGEHFPKFSLPQREDLSLNESLEVLRVKGIMSSPEYWLKLCLVGGNVDSAYLRKLITSMGKYVKDKK